jgi:serine/threonine-protein kinase
MSYIAARVIYRLGTDVTRARELGSYRLAELLGKGGMGEVWRAHHRMLARPAAIKLLRPEVLVADGGEGLPVVLRRFEREAQATALLRSPHTIHLYDFGVADDGSFYYVMELLEGFDLETLVRRFGPLPPPRTVHLLAQVCESLAEAHAEGLIHRDIKPANVYVCRYGLETDFVKVLDFGLVKPQQQRAEVEALRLTAGDIMGGTPAYMAPEQVLGDRPVDARTDIYAVGCLGYWLLTGQLVFEGETAMQLAMHHLQTPAVPPSARSELAVPRALDRLMLACLAKDPAHRPESAVALGDRLRECRGEDEWTRADAQRWWDTHAPRPARGGGALLAPA